MNQANANITGLGVDSVKLDEGFYLDATSTGYFDIKPCIENQSAARLTPPPGDVRPPDLWDWKTHFHY